VNKAKRNVEVWEALQYTTGRHPMEIMMQVLQVMDTLFLSSLRDVSEREGEDAALMTKLMDRATAVARQAKETITSGAVSYFSTKAQVEGEAIVEIFNAALDAVDLTEEQRRAMRRAMAEQLRAFGDRQKENIVNVKAIAAS